MASSDLDSILDYMYETGEFSDLDIVTATKTFEVHKSVVCPQCPFFYAACTSGFEESRSNTIRLEESIPVVDAILRHLYELDIDWLEDEDSVECGGEMFSRGRDAIDLMIAADKYNIERIGDRAFRTFLCAIHDPDLPAGRLIKLGQLFLSTFPAEITTHGREAIAEATTERMQSIIEDSDLWEHFHADKEYVKTVLWHASPPAETRPAKRIRISKVPLKKHPRLSCERT